MFGIERPVMSNAYYVGCIKETLVTHPHAVIFAPPCSKPILAFREN
jgi:hypothetical protein